MYKLNSVKQLFKIQNVRNLKKSHVMKPDINKLHWNKICNVNGLIHIEKCIMSLLHRFHMVWMHHLENLNFFQHFVLFGHHQHE